MNRDDIIRMAKEAGFNQILATTTGADVWIDDGFYVEELENFAVLVAAAERERVAAWKRARSYATGHGDTIEDLLKELEWQVAEREREACAKVCEAEQFELTQDVAGKNGLQHFDAGCRSCAEMIRARGEA